MKLLIDRERCVVDGWLMNWWNGMGGSRSWQRWKELKGVALAGGKLIINEVEG
jgi:hypothetical protein